MGNWQKFNESEPQFNCGLHFIQNGSFFGAVGVIESQSNYNEGTGKIQGANIERKPERPLAITFAVGGAGAQKEIGTTIIAKLSEQIKNKNLQSMI